MHNKISNDSILDPRTFLILLLMANIITFCQKSLWIEIGWIVFVDTLMLLDGKFKMAFKCILTFLILLFLQYIVLPEVPDMIAAVFMILVTYSIRMFPCLMIGGFMISKISLRRFVLAMRTLHIPEKLIIPLSVTIRYFPAIREEIHYIRQAMTLRHIKATKKLEAMLVPLMMSATATAEELSAAAVTRGIENPVKKTSILALKFKITDYLCIAMGCLFLVGTFLM